MNAITLIDGESIDATLGSILGRANSQESEKRSRKPRPSERPRWDRTVTAIRKFTSADSDSEVEAFFFLASKPRANAGFWRFVDVLPALGVAPVVMAQKPGASVVDDAIQATLETIAEERSPSDTQVLLATHDGGYVPRIDPLVHLGFEVTILGFPEYMSNRYLERERPLPVLDLENDLDAFDVQLPRFQHAIHTAASFDPRSLLGSRLH